MHIFVRELGNLRKLRKWNYHFVEENSGDENRVNLNSLATQYHILDLLQRMCGLDMLFLYQSHFYRTKYFLFNQFLLFLNLLTITYIYIYIISHFFTT